MKHENALIIGYNAFITTAQSLFVLYLQTTRFKTTVKFDFKRLPQLLELLDKDSANELIGTPIIIQDVPLGCTIRWIDNFLGFLTHNSFSVNENVSCKICSYDSSDYMNYCKTINQGTGEKNESYR